MEEYEKIIIELEKERLELEKRKLSSIDKKSRMRNILLFLIFIAILLLAYHCPCQCPNTVKGYELDKEVIDQNGNPLVGATVILYNHPNGMVVAQGETDSNGWYNFTNMQYGHYFLWVSYGGVTSSEWVWLTEDTKITNTLTLPTEYLGVGMNNWGD